jgi:hypothetical protein
MGFTKFFSSIKNNLSSKIAAIKSKRIFQENFFGVLYLYKKLIPSAVVSLSVNNFIIIRSL